jgi:hypothetical protein
MMAQMPARLRTTCCDGQCPATKKARGRKPLQRQSLAKWIVVDVKIDSFNGGHKMEWTKKLLVILAMLVFANIVSATVVDITVATDKTTYQLGEYVNVYVTAYNPTSQPVTLGFPTAFQATYLMDDTFNWAQGKNFAQSPTWRTIDPYGSYTWTRQHGADEMTLYPLVIGSHTIRGEVEYQGTSSPVQFEVVPEPCTFVIFSIALPFVRAVLKRNQYNSLRQELTKNKL